MGTFAQIWTKINFPGGCQFLKTPIIKGRAKNQKKLIKPIPEKSAERTETDKRWFYTTVCKTGFQWNSTIVSVSRKRR